VTTAHTQLCVLLGDPVAHSRSPAMFTAAFAAARIDATYLAWRVSSRDFSGAVRTLAALPALGASVTVPHKARAAALCGSLGEEARATGVANCLSFADGVRGENTDVHGILATLRALRARTGPVLVVGAGGAARAVLYALRVHGLEDVHVVNRTPARATALTRALGGQAHAWRDRDAFLAEAALVIHATSAQVRGESAPFEVARMHRRAALFDLTYGDTPLIRAARTRGVKAMDGSLMLREQAACAFELWTGKKAPRRAMARA
jgi:shikimate dehydrogenase